MSGFTPDAEQMDGDAVGDCNPAIGDEPTGDEGAGDAIDLVGRAVLPTIG